MAVCGPHPDGSWDSCETVSLFLFTGTPSEGLVLDTSDRLLRDLGAEAITIYPLSIPPAGRVAAVRSKQRGLIHRGHARSFTSAGRTTDISHEDRI